MSVNQYQQIWIEAALAALMTAMVVWLWWTDRSWILWAALSIFAIGIWVGALIFDGPSARNKAANGGEP